MGRFKIRERGISARKAGQLRMGIVLGELAYNMYLKKDINAARLAMIKASKMPKYTYLSALHALANRLGCRPDQFVL